MSKILVIDQGNSHAKLTIFDSFTPIEHIHLENLSLEEASPILERYDVEGAIYSSVTKIDARFAESLRMLLGGSLAIFTRETPLPIRIDYLSRSTLGLDRIAGAVAANHLFPDESVLVLDSGSALTADIITGGALVGGNISPGLSMRFRALNTFTGALPRIAYSAEDSLPHFGHTTEEAIRSGVVLGMLAEIEGWIQLAREDFGVGKVIFTGGHAPLVCPLVKSEAEILHEPLIVAIGLNIIYRYNETNL